MRTTSWLPPILAAGALAIGVLSALRKGESSEALLLFSFLAASIQMLYAADGLKRSSEERFPGILRDWGVGSLWFNWNYYALAWVASDTRIRHEPELRRQFTVYVVDAVLAAAAALCLVFML